MTKSVVAFFLLFALSVCLGMANNDRFVIDSAFCIDRKWSLVIFDNSTGEKINITPNGYQFKKCEFIFENFNPSEPSIVVRIGNRRYVAKLNKSSCSNESAVTDGLYEEMLLEDVASKNWLMQPSISRNEFLETVKNLN